MANRQEKVAALARDAVGAAWWTMPGGKAGGDGWHEYDDAVPVVATTLQLLAEHGPLGPVWWRFGRAGRSSLLEALDSPHTREAYDERQQAREEKARQEHAELMATLACSDCGDIPRQEHGTEYGPRGAQQWVRRPGGRCWGCHQQIQEHRKKQREAKAKARLEAAREANAKLRPCWTCRGSIGGKEGSRRELTEVAGPNRLECPDCEKTRRDKKLGRLVLPLPTLREQLAARVSTPADPWWQLRVQYATLYPAKDRR
ncbi:hypothetical protein ACIA8O_37325 [Kitasatospora sp. NPDC051853]|uniref:hypothetical protein n=1 Tax=Kitasatospora sp. NPDC051853 TaxID=3364058 RepID=UPI0037ABF51F